ncbi:DUF2199 domain-containing protein [Actinocorallia sp. B10E7]|uniref:DUF2199 domain-containing protein n=1 Tax=Actinocorallia sp. B10E7 TaxID=3153558 RepID=UPI00325DB566
MTAACACCGAALTETDRIDVGFRLPDPALGRPESDLTWLRKGLLRVAGEGGFLRCLLPVRLTGGVELWLGIWIEVSEEDLLRADEIWEDPAYAGFTATGRVANLVKPWGEEIVGAELLVDVRDVGELPVARSSPHPVLSRVVDEEWDRDRVLSRFGHALPIPVRVALDATWSVERTAGMEARGDGTKDRFSEPGRLVLVDVLRTSAPAGPEDHLRRVLEDAPDTAPEDRITETAPDGTLRHAFWLQREDHWELHGFALDGTTLVELSCLFHEPSDLNWALHVWRSIAHS